jgi:hypothetical protein
MLLREGSAVTIYFGDLWSTSGAARAVSLFNSHTSCQFEHVMTFYRAICRVSSEHAFDVWVTAFLH